MYAKEIIMKRKSLVVKVIPLLLISFVRFGQSQEPACCQHAKGSCAAVCKQLSLMTLASESGDEAIERIMGPIRTHCPPQLSTFWQCMNDTKKDLFQGSNWEGRYCCSMAQTRQCQSSCFTAQQSSDLKGKCRRGDESAVYQCLERQEEFETCCGQSSKAECVAACKIFLRETPQQSRRNGVRKRFNTQCEKETPVLSCVANLTHVSPVHNPEKNLPCCSRGRNLECQEACRKALKSASSEQAALETLVEKGCGHPRPDDQMWQCFLQNAEPKGTDLPSKIDRLGIDAAKLHCCHRASSATCRRLCHSTYSREWTGSWSDLDRVCLSSPSENALRSCVDEVEEPCELGCEGLTFCSAFNNRPSELFRRCNPIADTAARQDFEAWKSQGYIPLSDTMKLPLNFGLGQCVTEKWKAVACALQLKPCHPRTHASQICRSDCVSLLHECVDFDRLSLTGGHDVTSICELLSPPPGSQCISISSYTKSKTSSYSTDFQQEITRPCRNRPCNSTEMCHVNRNYQSNKGQPYSCQSGCSLGEVSKIIVSPGTWVRVPVQQGPGCQRLCRCGDDGRMEKCASSAVCDAPAPCWLGRNHIEHGSNFWLDCNHCSCRSGELICSKRQCASQEETGFLFSPSKTGTEIALPCNCNSIRSPVCGSNGRTYASSCLAKCGGLTDADITQGECAAKDPCENVNCGGDRRCIRTRRVCLLPSLKKCPQFQCVPLKCEETWHKSYQPVCDTEGRQHNNLCSLSTAGAMLAYYGPCFRSGCSYEGPICGVDGETYSSECAAEAQGIPKDYKGPCQFIGTGDGYHMEPSCSGRIECPPLPPNCIGVTPLGSCCPVCGGVLRVIYSPTQVQKLSETTDSLLISVDDIANRLSSLVQTAQCRTGVYLGLGTELVVVIKPVIKAWTKVQLQACVSETERLVTLISQQSPVIQVDAALSVLTAASMNHVISGAMSLSPLLSSAVGWIFIAVIFAITR